MGDAHRREDSFTISFSYIVVVFFLNVHSECDQKSVFQIYNLILFSVLGRYAHSLFLYYSHDPR